MMQQVKLFADPVLNSVGLAGGASSSDSADVKLDASSTTGAYIDKMCRTITNVLVSIGIYRGHTLYVVAYVHIEFRRDRFVGSRF